MDTIETVRPGPARARRTHPQDHLVAAVCDLNGIFRGKRMASRYLDKLMQGGMRMPLSAVGVDIWGSDVVDSGLTLGQGDRDGICTGYLSEALPILPDAGHSRLLPMWMHKEDGTPFFSDGRQMLAEVTRRYAERGLTPVVATELEFHLLDPGRATPTPAAFAPGAQAATSDNIYSLHELTSSAALFDAIYALAEISGITLESAIAEGGPRQFELTLQYQPDALKAADDTILLKQIVRSVAQQQGFEASFMVKTYADQSGNGLHTHFSALDRDGVNIFDNGGPEGTAALRHAVAGLIASMPDLTLLFAPHLNSYRRLVPGTLAPTKAVWGYETRTTAIRIPGGPAAARRIEHRVAGADANPYLVLAAVLAAALDGLDAKTEAPPPVQGNAYDQQAPGLEPDWRPAIDRFASSPLAARLLRPDLVHYLAACKRQELGEFATRMSAFEFETYRSSV